MNDAIRRPRLLSVAIAVAMTLGIVGIAVGHQNSWHTVNGAYHGHSVYGFYSEGTYAWTEMSNAREKTARIRRISDNALLCQDTTFYARAECWATTTHVSNAKSWHYVYGYLSGHWHGG